MEIITILIKAVLYIYIALTLFGLGVYYYRREKEGTAYEQKTQNFKKFWWACAWLIPILMLRDFIKGKKEQAEPEPEPKQEKAASWYQVEQEPEEVIECQKKI